MGTSAIIHDATVVTADEAGSIHHDGALVVEDRRIAAVGPTAKLLARCPASERIDGRGRAVLPGFANTRTRLPRTLARRIYEDLSPPHRPPFTGGLAPLPSPPLGPDEQCVMVGTTRLGAGLAGPRPRRRCAERWRRSPGS